MTNDTQQVWARELSDIPATLKTREDLRASVLALIDAEPIPGKVTEGTDRVERFKEVLRKVVRGELNLIEAEQATLKAIPREDSIYSSDNRTFPSGWAERQVKTQLSRFYNLAVLERLSSEGKTHCYVSHTSTESSRCSVDLAGKDHEVKTLRDNLIETMSRGNWAHKGLKVPEHPHCSHVVMPIFDKTVKD